MTASLDTAALAPVLRKELARRRLLDFAAAVYPGFEAPAHIRHIAGLLEDVEAGRLRRLAVSVPVRHGKSVLCSQIFPAWFLGRRPNRDVILASHSEDLAVRNSRIAKSLVQDDRWPFDVQLAGDSTSAGRWNTKQGGGAYAIGVGGGITGRGADLLLIDDALHDALSVSERESAWRWYSEVAVPRLEPGGAIVLIGARFAGDDLHGRIMDSEDGPNWTVVRLPALAEENDPLGRDVGAALWPERMGVAELEQRRVQMGSRAFSAQFQQAPIPLDGLMFKSAWFDQRYTTVPADARIIQTCDGSWKTGVSHDWSVIATWAATKTHFYLVDLWRRKVEFPALKAAAIAQYELHRPSKIVVEDAASGIAVIQSLRAETNLPVVAVSAAGSKQSRAEAVTPLFEAGRVLLPHAAPWLDAWLEEHLRFPDSPHDDMVDTTAMALTQLRRPESTVSWGSVYRFRSAGPSYLGGGVFR